MSAAEIEAALDWHDVPDADEALDTITRLPAADQATALERFTRPKWSSKLGCLIAYDKAMGR
jgi:hypothetical protein